MSGNCEPNAVFFQVWRERDQHAWHVERETETPTGDLQLSVSTQRGLSQYSAGQHILCPGEILTDDIAGTLFSYILVVGQCFISSQESNLAYSYTQTFFNASRLRVMSNSMFL